MIPERPSDRAWSLPQFRIGGPATAPLTIILAHGAGAAMDTPFMAFFAHGLAEAGYL